MKKETKILKNKKKAMVRIEKAQARALELDRKRAVRLTAEAEQR